jgi:hypothetical protein
MTTEDLLISEYLQYIRTQVDGLAKDCATMRVRIDSLENQLIMVQQMVRQKSRTLIDPVDVPVANACSGATAPNSDV